MAGTKQYLDTGEKEKAKGQHFVAVFGETGTEAIVKQDLQAQSSDNSDKLNINGFS